MKKLLKQFTWEKLGSLFKKTTLKTCKNKIESGKSQKKN